MDKKLNANPVPRIKIITNSKNDITASKSPINAQVLPVLTLFKELEVYKLGVSSYNLMACFDRIKAMIANIKLIIPAKQNRKIERMPSTKMVDEFGSTCRLLSEVWSEFSILIL
nr:hypothetical protein [Labilibaculum antarcticum]